MAAVSLIQEWRGSERYESLAGLRVRLCQPGEPRWERTVDVISARRLYSDVYEFRCFCSDYYTVKVTRRATFDHEAGKRTGWTWTWGEVRKDGCKRVTSSKPGQLGEFIGRAVVASAERRAAEWGDA